MNPYVASIVGALNGSGDGLMTFTPTDFPAGGISTPPVSRKPTPAPVAEPQQIVSNNVAPQEARKPNVVNPGYQSQAKGKGGSIDGGKDTFKGSGLTSYQIEHYMKGMGDYIKAGESIANGYLAYGSAKMKASSLRFEARQNERNVQLLYKNMREISRAADADANVHRVRGAERKSEQRVAMAASGFAVGKGVYKNTLYTTDARTEYNVAMLKLKAGLQNAEILRQIGVEEAQAEIKRGEASIEKRYGEAKLAQGWANGISEMFSGTANFYMGYKGEGATKGGK